MALRLVKSSARKSLAGALAKRPEFIEFITRLARAQARVDAREYIARAAEIRRQTAEVTKRRLDRLSRRRRKRS
jgi:hypothetical protein